MNRLIALGCGLFAAASALADGPSGDVRITGCSSRPVQMKCSYTKPAGDKHTWAQWNCKMIDIELSDAIVRVVKDTYHSVTDAVNVKESRVLPYRDNTIYYAWNTGSWRYLRKDLKWGVTGVNAYDDHVTTVNQLFLN